MYEKFHETDPFLLTREYASVGLLVGGGHRTCVLALPMTPLLSVALAVKAFISSAIFYRIAFGTKERVLFFLPQEVRLARTDVQLC